MNYVVGHKCVNGRWCWVSKIGIPPFTQNLDEAFIYSTKEQAESEFENEEGCENEIVMTLDEAKVLSINEVEH